MPARRIRRGGEFHAQYRLIYATRKLAVVAALEAAIPDAAALVFACLGIALVPETVTPLAALGGLVLWLLRLALAPVSTLAGFRAWVMEQCPVAPGRLASRPQPASRRTRLRSCGRPRRPASFPW